jgi:hypothetical protein
MKAMFGSRNASGSIRGSGEGGHVLTIKRTCGHGRKTRPYETTVFVGATIMVALRSEDTFHQVHA